MTILTAPTLLGPYTVVRSWYHPLGMNAGDFDIAVDEHDGRAYYYFERVHSELVCADLTDDYTDVTGRYTSHFPIRTRRTCARHPRTSLATACTT